MAELEPTPKIITLGPEGSDHERATRLFIDVLGLRRTVEISLVDDLVGDGLERVRTEPASFLLQCSAHPHGNVINMRHHKEVVMMAAFMYPTKEMGLLVRREVEEPRSLGLMPATIEYLDHDRWPTITKFVEESSKPVVATGLLAGKYDAGIASVDCAQDNPEVLRVAESFGTVNTAWLVYRHANSMPLPNVDEVFGIKIPQLTNGE
jgi:hypothetical protein